MRRTFRLAMDLTDSEWLRDTGEAAYFVYPVHSSGTFMSSKSVSSTLYLFAMRMLTRKYKEAFRLIDSCVLDSVLTPQENQFLTVINSNPDDLLVDARACRLKLFFVAYGCSDVMSVLCNVEQDYVEYINNFKLVSSYCRLTVEEEIFILGQIPSNSPHRSLHMNNREKLIRASFDLSFEKFTPKLPTRSFTATYPPPMQSNNDYNPIDLGLIEAGSANLRSMLSKLAIVKYARPDQAAIHGPDAIRFLGDAIDAQQDMGFFYLYEMLTGHVNIAIIPDEAPHKMGSVLLRFLPGAPQDDVQGVILRIMESHPEISKKMPEFTDTRRFKMPTIAGLDVFQSHIKRACETLRSHMDDLNIARLQHNIPKAYKPSAIVHGSATIMDSEG